MENKYYTPSLEEFNVGFEYEILRHSSHDSTLSGWFKTVFSLREDSNEIDLLFNKRLIDKLRVKYLDSSDIESFGFIVNDTIHFRLENMLFAGKNKVYKFEYKHLIYFIQHLDGLYEGCDNKVIVSVYNN